jgi:hypothetical protein
MCYENLFLGNFSYTTSLKKLICKVFGAFILFLNETTTIKHIQFGITNMCNFITFLSFNTNTKIKMFSNMKGF